MSLKRIFRTYSQGTNAKPTKELLIDEKKALLGNLVSRGGRLFFTHDPGVALGTVTQDDRGRYSVNQLQVELSGVWI